MSNPSNASNTGLNHVYKTPSNVREVDRQRDAFNAGYSISSWPDELQALAERFGCGVAADMAMMTLPELLALHGFMKAKAGGE